MATISSVTADLSALIERLDLKGKLPTALKRTLGREARKVKAKAVRAMPEVHNARAIAKTIRAKPYRNMQGFIVAADPHGDPSMHRNRRGLLKPIAFWLNVGTTDRTTRHGRWHRDKSGHWKQTPPHPTGSTKAWHYMEAAEAELPAAEKRLEETFEKEVRRLAAKTFRT